MSILLRGQGLLSICMPVMLLLLGSVTDTQAATPSATYWTLVAETIAVLEDESPERASLNELAERWQLVDVVILADGRQQPINTAPLVKKLRASDTDWSLLHQQLSTLLAQQESWPRSGLNIDEVMAALNNVLSDDQFNYLEDEPNFLERLWIRIVTAVLDLLSRLLGNSGLTFVTGNFLTVLLVLFLVVVLGLIVRTILRDFVSEAELAESLQRDKILTADTALSQAQAHSEEGDYRTAVRYLYLSCLLSLEERGLLRYDRSLTNREYLRSVAHVPEVAAILRDVVTIFDRVWYGYQPITAETYRHYAAQVQALRQRG